MPEAFAGPGNCRAPLRFGPAGPIRSADAALTPLPTEGNAEMRKTVLIAAILAAALLAGCGSSSSSSSSSSSTSTEPSTATFKSEFASYHTELHALGQEIGAAITGAPKQSNQQLESEFSALATKTTALAGKLSSLSVPAAYKQEVGTLESALTQVAGSLHGIEAAAAAGDPNAAKAASATLVVDSGQVKASTKQLLSKLGLPGE